jgi:hypothetical protein
MGSGTRLGNALAEARRFEKAITAHQDAAAIHRATGHRHGKVMALTTLGNALRHAGRFEEATTSHQNAAAIFGEAGDEHRQRIAAGQARSVPGCATQRPWQPMGRPARPRSNAVRDYGVFGLYGPPWIISQTPLALGLHQLWFVP